MRRSGLALGALALLLGALGPAGDARAQIASASEPLPSPGKALASDDDASAIAVNPANLAFLPAPEARYTFLWTGSDVDLARRGHVIEAAAPLFFLGGGLRVELHNPPDNALAPLADNQGGRPYQWVRFGAAGRVDEWLGLGASLGWSISDAASLDGMFGLTAGFTLRPTEWLSWSGLIRDLNGPVSRDNFGRAFRSWETGVALRPIAGRRDLELGVEGKLYDQLGAGQLRGVVGVDLPNIGRLRGDVRVLELTDRPIIPIEVTAGLEVNYGPGQAFGGAMMSNTTGFDVDGFYAGAALRMYREPGIPLMPKRVARIDIADTPGTRGHFHLLRKLWRLADNDEVEGVLFVMHDEPASSLAHGEELGDAIRMLRARGKKVACHLEDAGGKALFTCSQADRIAINPAGGLRYSGLSSRYFYFGGTLDKLGVKSDFVRIGAHKSAAEQLTMKGATSVSAADHQDLVDRYEEVFLHDVGGGRRIPARALKETLAKGPFLASEARSAKLVDELVYPDEIGRFMQEVMGGPAQIVKSLPFSEAPKRWTRDKKIAVIYLAGDMVDGESQTIPLINIRLAGSRTIAGALKKARDDDSIKAVVFRVETGGGSSLAADVILREAQLLAKKKPLIVSMGSVAASGGYYVSVGGGSIYALRTTLTGSIGIFYGKVDVTGLMDKLGVGSDAYRSSPRADVESFFRPFSDDERVELTRKVKQFYDLFVGRVAEGRHMKPEEVDAIGRGHVWSGAQAKERRLVDKIGGMREALEEARSLADLPEDTLIVELPEEDDSLLGFLLKLVGLSVQAQGPQMFIPPPLLDVARALAPFTIYDGTQPLARAEIFEEGVYPARMRPSPDADAGGDPYEEDAP